MNSPKTLVAISQHHSSLHILALVSGMIFFSPIGPFPVQAADSSDLWECSNYEGAAQTRCLNGFIEMQREKISQLEGRLQAQSNTIGQLKDRIDHQAAATANLQEQISRRPSTGILSVPYPHTYYYPPSLGLGLGLGLYLGHSWGYASPNYYRPYWEGRSHRHSGHRR